MKREEIEAAISTWKAVPEKEGISFSSGGVEVILSPLEVRKLIMWLCDWKAGESRWHVRTSLTQVVDCLNEMMEDG